MQLTSTRVRRTGRTALSILVLGLVVAGGAIRLLDLPTVVALVGLIGGVPALTALYIAWAGYRDDRLEATPVDVDDIADELAAAVRNNVEAEAVRLNDPYPLSVSWRPAPAALMQTWASIVRLAKEGAGWAPPESADSWLSGAHELSGSGGVLAKLLKRIPTQRLVILGEAGSGKSVLTVRLALDLLGGRAHGDAVPVRFLVASWDPSDVTMRDWMKEHLERDFSGLSAPAGDGHTTWAEILLDRGRIMPILDGFDEIPVRLRSRAIAAINDSLRPNEPIVVTSRTTEFSESIGRTGGANRTIIGAAVIMVDALETEEAIQFLQDAAEAPESAARWTTVFEQGGSLLSDAVLSTPLMIILAKTVYNIRSGEDITRVPDPTELLDRKRFPDRAAVERHLLQAFVKESYRSGPSRPATCRWRARQAESYLRYLARQMEERNVVELSWWELRYSAGYPVAAALGLIQGSLCGVALSLAGVGPWLSAAIGAVIFAVYSWAIRRADDRPVTGLGWAPTWSTLYWIGLCVPAAWYASFAVTHSTGYRLVSTVGLSLIALGVFEARSVAQSPLAARSPNRTLGRDRAVALMMGIAHLVVVASCAGLGLASHGIDHGYVVGILLGSVLALNYMLEEPVWGFYAASVGWLALRRHLPFRLMPFLTDAHLHHGILRQVGATYTFRHVELQRHLANT